MHKIKCMKGITRYYTYTAMSSETTVTTQGRYPGKTAASSLKIRVQQLFTVKKEEGISYWLLWKELRIENIPLYQIHVATVSCTVKPQ